VPVQINRSVTLQFLVDPGSAVVVIPRSVLNSLVLNGTATQAIVPALGARAGARFGPAVGNIKNDKPALLDPASAPFAKV
jgi:hypothetical protein